MSLHHSAFGGAGQPRGKVQIPRLQRSGQATNTPKDRRRVTRACTACRSHKIKCTGDHPRCANCEAAGRECVYILPRKDRLKIVTERCIQMARVLKDLGSRVDEEDNAKISELLEAVEDDFLEGREEPLTPSNADNESGDCKPSRFSPSDSLPHIESDSMDLLDEDLTRDERSRATGYVGKNSEIQWLRSVKLQLEKTSSSDGSRKNSIPCAIPMTQGSQRQSSQGSLEQVSSFTFYLDCEDVDLDFQIDPYEMPTPDMAEKLINCYMTTIHDSFPILPRQPFEQQVHAYLKNISLGRAQPLSPKWQAILNLVFAIGAKYSHLIKAYWRGDERDHLIYQARARLLGLNETTITSHPDVAQIQVAGLLSCYYLTVGQVSRAWIVIGLALRFAYALGLHVRNEDPSAPVSKKELLVRIWWSLYSLERLLSAITGRPCSVVDAYCSVPLPPGSEPEPTNNYNHYPQMHGYLSDPTSRRSVTLDSVNSSRKSSSRPKKNAYFRAVVQISMISESIQSILYPAGTMVRSLEQVQQSILELDKRLDQWSASLPAGLNFQGTRRPSDPSQMEFFRERTMLGFQYYSAKMLLSRPYLGSQAQGMQSSIPATFVRRMSQACIEAAKATTDLLPDLPDSLFVYHYGPWWSIVHHLMQALSVFCLGLSYTGPEFSDSLPLTLHAKKIVQWLVTMEESNPLASRAHQVALGVLQSVATQHPIDFSDLVKGVSNHDVVMSPVVDPSFALSFPSMPDSYVSAGPFTPNTTAMLGALNNPITTSQPNSGGFIADFGAHANFDPYVFPQAGPFQDPFAFTH